MKFKRFITVCTIIAVVCMVPLGLSTAAPAENELPANSAESAAATAPTKNKDEVVYATLTPSGNVEAIYVVNHFSAAQGGDITDYGDYASVVNLTNTNDLAVNGDSVSFVAGEDNFYYQGNMAGKDLPWIFNISYYLNGEQMAPQDIAGADGALEIKISSSPNDLVDSTFYDHYMLQITVTLDTEKCSNIEAPDGTSASAGKNKTIAFTVLPENNADFALTADVRDFTMTGISIAAVPYSMSMDFPDTDEQFSDLEKLPDAISELNDGVGELDEGTMELKDGADQLSSGSAGIQSGLNQLSGNSAQLVNASAQINGALSQIATSLAQSGIENIDLSAVSQLPAGLTAWAGGLRELSGGLTTFQGQFAPAYAALDATIAKIPDPAISETDIQTLYAMTDPSQYGTVGALVDNYGAAQEVKGTYASVKDAFDGVGTVIDSTTAAIGTMADTLDTTATQISSSLSQLDGLSQLSELVSGLSTLSANYSSFHSGLVAYTGGVQTLASNYSSFHSGITSFDNGVTELSDGVGELYDGTNTLNDEIADLPDTLQSEIDNMKDQYMPADFDAVSFASSKNTDTGFVQFVMQTEPIEEPDAPEADAPDTDNDEPETFWDRLVALFSGEK